MEKAQLEAAGVPAELIAHCEASGINLAALLALVIKYGPQLMAFLNEILPLINPTPTPVPAPRPAIAMSAEDCCAKLMEMKAGGPGLDILLRLLPVILAFLQKWFPVKA